ncbi:MAG TPA: hypothetical protein PL045_00625 [Chitinophagaceae bacterium]|nr:hypothetical protein [Chitinophagaceae bacterium]
MSDEPKKENTIKADQEQLNLAKTSLEIEALRNKIINDQKDARSKNKWLREWLGSLSTLIGIVVATSTLVYTMNSNAKKEEESRALEISGNVIALQDSLDRVLKSIDAIKGIPDVQASSYFEIQMMALGQKIIPFLIQRYTEQPAGLDFIDDSLVIVDNPKREFLKKCMEIISRQKKDNIKEIRNQINERFETYISTQNLGLDYNVINCYYLLKRDFEYDTLWKSGFIKHLNEITDSTVKNNVQSFIGHDK